MTYVPESGKWKLCSIENTLTDCLGNGYSEHSHGVRDVKVFGDRVGVGDLIEVVGESASVS